MCTPQVYDQACRGNSFQQMPSLAQLTRHFADVPAGDLFAYTLVASLADRCGVQRVSALLREPSDLHAALGANLHQIETGWNAYSHRHCGTPFRQPRQRTGQPNTNPS